MSIQSWLHSSTRSTGQALRKGFSNDPFDQFDNTVSHRQEAPQIASEPVQEAQDGRRVYHSQPVLIEPEPDAIWANMKSPPVQADVPERTPSRAIRLNLDTSDAAILDIDRRWRENDKALAREMAAPVLRIPRFMR